MPTHLLSVVRPEVQDVWRKLDTSGLQKLRSEAEAVRQRENLIHTLFVAVGIAAVVGLYSLLKDLLAGDWLGATLVSGVVAVLLFARLLAYQEKAARPLQDLGYFLRPLSEPVHADRCREMLSLSRSLPACQAYRQAVLEKKREFIVADFHVMQQLQAEKNREKALAPYLALSRPESEVEVAF